LCIIACSNLSENPANNGGFVQGELVVGFNDSASFADTYIFLDSLGLSIQKLQGYYYAIKVDQDSLVYYQNLILSKPYARIGGQVPIFRFEDSLISVCMVFSNFYQKEAIDWFIFLSEYHIYEIASRKGTIGKSGIINVPIGKEYEYFDIIKNASIIKYVVPNYYIYPR
jgi:hypothetical protein